MEAEIASRIPRYRSTVHFLAICIASCWLLACAQPNATHLPERISYSPIQVGSTDLLFRDSSLLDQLEVLEDRIILYADSLSKAERRAEAIIYQEEYGWFRQAFYHLPFDSLLKIYLQKGVEPLSDEQWARGEAFRPNFQAQADSSLPLSGLRVAIDPGHTAGNIEIALLEGKYVKMKPSRYTDYEPIAFWEANLTLATAKLIQRELEAQGAEVMLTRNKPGKGALGLTYPEWKLTDQENQFVAEELARGKLDSQQLDFFLNEVPEKVRMSRFFTQQDLRERARLINAFQPHLTLIIHYNIHGPSWDARDLAGNLKPEKQNYLMAFVPGSFLKGELAFPSDRLSLLRMLLTEDVPKSVALSQAFVKESVRHTAVPIVDPELPLAYLQEYSLMADSGVYARNLSLTRMVHGPLVYGESLCQESFAKAKYLDRRDLEIEPGFYSSSRLQDVANAFVGAVHHFVGLEIE